MFEHHKKVPFNIVSKESYVYILLEKFIKNGHFENLKFGVKHCYQTGHFFFVRTKVSENAKNEKLKCNFDHFEYLGLKTKHETCLN